MKAESCPVCGARFRETRDCSRCGADLTPLMFLTAEAYRLRREARRRLSGGEAGGAFELAQKAQTTATTLEGHRLARLCAWLSE